MGPAIGYAIREHHHPLFSDPAINAAQITLDRARIPDAVNHYVRGRKYDLVSVHARQLSVAGDEAPSFEEIDLLKAVAEETGALSVSDHLCTVSNSDSRAELTHFVPPPYTRGTLSRTCRNVKRIQKRFGNIRFFVGNIAQASPYVGKLTEAEFLSGLLQRTGCGWLLDVTNAYVNGRNFGIDPYDFIEEVMPSAASVQIHITGGGYDEQTKRHVVDPASAIPEPVWDLYRFGLEMAHRRAGAVFLARDEQLPGEETWRQEFQTAREISEEVGAIG